MSKNDEKPKRLYFKSYIQLLNNSVGSNVFRNFYVKTREKGEFDALDDGHNSCAFFVSSILVIFKKLTNIHGTVKSTINDLKKSGWIQVEKPEPGDVVIWEAKMFNDGLKQHIGFFIGDSKAISTSLKHQTPVEHNINFGSENRKVEQVYRHLNWDNDNDKP